MLVVVAYDVNTETDAGKRRLRQVAKLCENHGQRVQFSLFECSLQNDMWVKLRARLAAAIDPESDSLRFYFLGNAWHGRVEHIGAKRSHDPESPLIV
ncbi:MAG: CRISPR-associated endonuclease Cas2 [Terracidiphilus sp.]